MQFDYFVYSVYLTASYIIIDTFSLTYTYLGAYTSHPEYLMEGDRKTRLMSNPAGAESFVKWFCGGVISTPSSVTSPGKIDKKLSLNSKLLRIYSMTDKLRF